MKKTFIVFILYVRSLLKAKEEVPQYRCVHKKNLREGTGMAGTEEFT